MIKRRGVLFFILYFGGLSVVLNAQTQFAVSGRVLNALGEPLEGALLMSEQANVVQSWKDGRFKMFVDNRQANISCQLSGYQSAEKKLIDLTKELVFVLKKEAPGKRSTSNPGTAATKRNSLLPLLRANLRPIGQAELLSCKTDASFTITNNSCNAPCEVRFTNNSVATSSFEWQLQNYPKAITTKDASWVYDIPGQYRVALLAKDGRCSDVMEQTVTILPPETGFRVVELMLRADPFNYAGPCPKEIVFSARMATLGGSGTISYRWLRNDGASAPIETIRFDGPGTKDFKSTWYLGGAGSNFRDFWKQVQIVQVTPDGEAPKPKNQLSNKAMFTLICQ